MKCVECKFFNKNFCNDECRRYPPKVFIYPKGDSDNISCYPNTTEDKWCGEYIPIRPRDCMENDRYIGLGTLAIRLGLSRAYLKAQAKAGRIPHLIVSGHMRFSEKEVRESLAKITRKQSKDKEKENADTVI